MLVNRRSNQVKRGPIEDAVSLVKEALQWVPAGMGPTRVYISSIGDVSQIALEVELQAWLTTNGSGTAGPRKSRLSGGIGGIR